jgi:hypothetical protein
MKIRPPLLFGANSVRGVGSNCMRPVAFELFPAAGSSMFA